MAELIIKGNDKYIKKMYNHLRKEHPSTKKKMHIEKPKTSEMLEPSLEIPDAGKLFF